MAWDLSNVIINLKAKIAEISAQIPGLATTSKAGIVKPDGTTITIEDGVISAAGSEPESVTLTKTSGETWGAILFRLFNAVDISKLKGTSYIKCYTTNTDFMNTLFVIYKASPGLYKFYGNSTSAAHVAGLAISLFLAPSAVNTRAYQVNNDAITDIKDTEYPGETITLYY